MTLTDWAEDEGYSLTVKNGSLLIDNDEPITIHDAKGMHNHFILRWRHRTCRLCAADFDISLGGFGFTCPSCLKMEAPV